MRGKLNPFPSSEYALLGFLFAKPTHGYELHKLVTDPSGIGAIWGVKMSNLYAQLDKLEKKGFITGELLAGETHPTKTQYHISSDGKEAFNSWLVSTVQHPRDFRQEFLLRLYFLQKYLPDSTYNVIERQLSECEKWLSLVTHEDLQIYQKGSFVNSVFEFRRSQIKSMKQWLEWLTIQLNNIIPNEVQNEKV